MHNKLTYSFEDHLKESLKDPKFRLAWKKSEPEYLLAKGLIEKRLKGKLSQRALARKSNTTQAVISRIETMNGNPSLSLLKRIAEALGTELQINFK